MNAGDPHVEMLMAVRDHAARGQDETGDPVLGDVVSHIDRLGPPAPVEPRSRPVVAEWLAPAVGRAIESTRPLADLIARHHDRIHWEIPYTDVIGDPDIAFMRTRYAYGLLAGPVGADTVPWCTRELLLGFVIQGPDVMYPAHRHPAVEVYVVIGGTARWRRGDEDWTERAPGSVIVHDAGMIHATHTVDEPMLAWVAWTTEVDVDREPELVRDG